MSEEKKYKNYNAADIVKYHRGLLSTREMNDLEKAALDDPFLADALEGYGTTRANISSDLSELEKKLEERVSDRKLINLTASRFPFKWWKVAAAVVVFGGVGYFVFEISTARSNKEVAVTLEEKKSTAPTSTIMPDSNKSKTVESTSVGGTVQQTEIAAKSNAEVKKATRPASDDVVHKNELHAEETNLSQSAVSDHDVEKKDSIAIERALSSSAPAAIEKRSEAADDRQKRGITSPKQEAVLNEGFQANYFRGRVTDPANNPIPFANITSTRDGVGTYTDAQGRFTLEAPDSVVNVEVRSVGFENNTVQFKSNIANNDVVLQENKAAANKKKRIQKTIASPSRVSKMEFGELEPADGWNNYDTYLANNLNIPEDIRRKDEIGREVKLSFEVNEQGIPVNIRVEKSLCEKCDEEAIRVVKQGPKWKNKNKKAKRVTISVPFDTEQ